MWILAIAIIVLKSIFPLIQHELESMDLLPVFNAGKCMPKDGDTCITGSHQGIGLLDFATVDVLHWVTQRQALQLLSGGEGIQDALTPEEGQYLDLADRQLRAPSL